MAKILIVEDEGIVAKSIESKVLLMGHEVAGIVNSAAGVLELVKVKNPDLILMDINLQGERDGIDVATELNEVCDIPIIYLTAYFDNETLSRAKLTKPYGFLVKPFGAGDLRANITMALFKHQAESDKKVENALMGSFRNIHEGLVITDQSGCVLLMNAMAEKMTGWGQEDAKGLQTQEVLHFLSCDKQRKIEHPVQIAFHQHKVVINDEYVFLLAKDQSKAIVKVEAIPVQDDEGVMIGVVCVLRSSPDDFRCDEGVLKEIRKELKDSNQFISNVDLAVHNQIERLGGASERVRCPINALMVYTQLLKKVYLDKDKEITNEVFASGNNLLALITDVLNILKIETDQLRLENEKFCLDYLINEIALIIHPKLKENNLQIKNDIADDVFR